MPPLSMASRMCLGLYKHQAPLLHQSRVTTRLLLHRPSPLRSHFNLRAHTAIRHSSTSSRTTIAGHPRKDDDGNDMTIDITPRAAQRLSEIMKREKNPSLMLRVHVTSGGCHGFQYTMSLADGSELSAEDDTVFQAYPTTTTTTTNSSTPSSPPSSSTATTTTAAAAKVVLDQSSLEILKGSKIDYTDELIGSEFRVVDNPKATSSCGCGTSFDVRF